MKLFSCVFLVLVILAECYCAPFSDWLGHRERWPRAVTDCGFGVRHYHGLPSRPWQLGRNIPYDMTQLKVEKSRTSMPQYVIKGITGSCWYDDGTPYSPDDTPYRRSGIRYYTSDPLNNPFSYPYGWYGGPHNQYGMMYSLYTPSGHIICSADDRLASSIGYISRNSLDNPSTNSADSSSENLPDYTTVSPVDNMPTENRFPMTNVNPFDNAVDVYSLDTARTGRY